MQNESTTMRSKKEEGEVAKLIVETLKLNVETMKLNAKNVKRLASDGLAIDGEKDRRKIECYLFVAGAVAMGIGIGIGIAVAQVVVP